MAQETQKKTILDKEFSRRDFLKYSGRGIAGIALTTSILSAVGCTVEHVEKEQVSLWATPQGVLVANRAKCTGCQRCETACTTLNDGKIMPYIARVKVRPHYFYGDDGVGSGGGHYGDLQYSPITCRQCEEPGCAAACPQQAIYADEKTGARTVDVEKCIGCGACVQGCPWNVPTVDPEIQKSTKCISCGECAAACPTGALTIVPWENLEA